MKQRIVKVIVVLLLVGLAYYAYKRWQEKRAENTGELQLMPDGSEEASRTVIDKTTIDTSHTTQPAAAPVVTQTTTPVTTTATTTATTTQTIPTTDSIPANPPNGMVFAGTGKYQLYRQGSITWRLDTDNGHACIIFATDEEWRKQRVYSHGCGND